MATLHVGAEGVGSDGVNGSVGIGTTSPAASLHVAGSANVVRLDHVGITNNPHFWLTQNAYYDGSWHRITSGNAVAGISINDSAGDVNIITDTSTTGTPAPATVVVFKNNGSVGIGTTSPAEKLDVNGGIKIGDSTGISAGTLRVHGGVLQYQTGTAWKNVVLQ